MSGRVCLQDMIGDFEAHLWRVHLDSAARDWPEWPGVLSPDETAKAARFVRPRDRFRFSVSRAVLRRLLGEYLDRDPAGFSIAFNRFGKPSLPQSEGLPRLTFSVSHSEDFALFGFARGRVIGVDIEKMKADAKDNELAGSICCDRELAALASLPQQQRFVEFYRYWTLKEAYVKALGVGLSFPVQKVEIMPSVAAPMNLAWNMSDLRVRGRWTAVSINDICGYAAAAAVAGNDIAVRHRSWPDNYTP